MTEEKLKEELSEKIKRLDREFHDWKSIYFANTGKEHIINVIDSLHELTWNLLDDIQENFVSKEEVNTIIEDASVMGYRLYRREQEEDWDSESLRDATVSEINKLKQKHNL